MNISNSASKSNFGVKPEEAIGIPLAEVDKNVLENTFCVISQSWGQTHMHRYTSLPTLFVFHPYSSVRRAAIAFTTHICYDICLMIIVFAYLVELAIPQSLPLLFEQTFLIFYLAEALYETIARGFMMGSYAYLRNPWMCLDFVITLLSLPDLDLKDFEVDESVTFGIQSLRGIRIFNLISKIPGVQNMVEAILLSMFRMYGVALIMILFLVTVSLTAKQLFMGIYWRKCVKDPSSNFPSLNISYEDYVNDYANWAVDEHNNYIMCGNSTDAQKCHENFTCLNTVVKAPESDITSFDTFSLSVINSFRLLTQDEWENIYDTIIQATGPFSAFFFAPVIFLGSFFLLNLMVVVVTSSFDSIMKSENEDLPLCWDLECGYLPPPSQNYFQKHVEKASLIEGFLQKILVAGWKKFRWKLKIFSDSKVFRLYTVLIIIFNTALLAVEHARMSTEFTLIMKYCSVAVTCLFGVEMVVYLTAQGKYYFFNWWNIVDFFIVVQAVTSIVLNFFAEYTIFRSLRLMELIKIQQAWPALHRVIFVVLYSIRNILKLLFVMILIIFTFAVIGNRVLGHLLMKNVEVHRWSFKTFGGSLFTVFKIFAGDWYEPLTNCMATCKIPILCIIIIIPYYIVGYLVILNVFTAVFLSAFDASALKLPKFHTVRNKS